MRALDLFCGAGGASYGLFMNVFHEIVGVDIHSQPNYPFEFVQADALNYPLDGFDFIWASPPCQAHTRMQKVRGRQHPDLIPAIRQRLLEQDTPWVIENVVGAPLIDPVMLCGAMFGLRMYRHRLFETSWLMKQPKHPKHTIRTERAGRLPKDGGFISVAGHFPGVSIVREAMGVQWMKRDEIAQAIPPAYSQYIAVDWLKNSLK